MAHKQDYTVEDIEQLLNSNGAGTLPNSQIRRWNYEQIIPSQQYFENLFKLGEGGYGAVYQLPKDGTNYALKIMKLKKGEKKQDLINSFYNECKALLSVNHDRVLRLVGVVLDTSDPNDYCFCTLTILQQKGSLYDIIKKKQIFSDFISNPQQRFLRKIQLLCQIAEGINAIHIAGLVHRDIKSPNIFLDENYGAKVADLGIANQSETGVTSKAKGTRQWMAPEMFNFRVGKESDI